SRAPAGVTRMVDRTAGSGFASGPVRSVRVAFGEAQMTELEQVAAESWLFGYPLVLMDVTRRVTTGHGLPPNTFEHMRSFPAYPFTAAVLPNADPLSSVGWLDLRAEPIVLSIPEMAGRFHMFPMASGWTDVFFSPGSRTTGDRGGDYAIVGPGW